MILLPFLNLISVFDLPKGCMSLICEWAIHEHFILEGEAVGKKYIPLEGSIAIGALCVILLMPFVPSSLPFKLLPKNLHASSIIFVGVLCTVYSLVSSRTNVFVIP